MQETYRTETGRAVDRAEPGWPTADGLRVLMLAPGWCVHSERTAKLLVGCGCRLTFVDNTQPPGAAAAECPFVRYPVIRGRRLCRALLGAGAEERLHTAALAYRLRRLYRRVRPHVVHVHWADRRLDDCARAGLRPLVLSAWGTDINQHFLPEADAEARHRAGVGLRGVDFVLGDSTDLLEKCSALAGRDLPSGLLSYGVDARLFRPGYKEAVAAWRTRLALEPGMPVVFSARGFQPKYGQDLILEAFHRALPRLRRPAVLLFKTYGPQPATRQYEEQLRARARELRIHDAVRWIDGVPFDQLPGLYNLAAVVVSYAPVDAFPVTFLEAAACERPVVCNRLPAYRGTFAEGNFRLAEPDDPDALAAALVDELAQPGDRRRPALQAARRLVCEEHAEEAVARRLLEVYRAVSVT